MQGTADAAKEEIFKSRVRSIRDVVEVKFQVEGENRFENSSTTIKWVCPVTKKTLGPGVKAVYLVPCGHAFLESAVKEMPGENCLHVGVREGRSRSFTDLTKCNECYTPDNIISILPSSTREQERLKTRAERLNQQGLTHSLKKATGASKKRKKNVVAADALISKQVLDESKPPLRPSEGTSSTSRASINNEETASLTAKVIAEEQDRHKRRRMGANENLKSLFSSKNGMDEKHTDFMTRGFSIPSVSGSKR